MVHGENRGSKGIARRSLRSSKELDLGKKNPGKKRKLNEPTPKKDSKRVRTVSEQFTNGSLRLLMTDPTGATEQRTRKLTVLRIIHEVEEITFLDTIDSETNTVIRSDFKSLTRKQEIKSEECVSNAGEKIKEEAATVQRNTVDDDIIEEANPTEEAMNVSPSTSNTTTPDTEKSFKTPKSSKR